MPAMEALQVPAMHLVSDAAAVALWTSPFPWTQGFVRRRLAKDTEELRSS